MQRLFQLLPDALPHVTYLGRTATPCDWQHFSRNIQEYVLYILCSGEMYLMENNKKYALKPGDMILLEPGLLHRGYRTSSCTYLYAHFPQNTFLSLQNFSPEHQHMYIQDLIRLNYNESSISDALYSQSAIRFPKLLRTDETLAFHQIVQIFTDAIRINESKPLFYKSLVSCRLMEFFTLISSLWTETFFTDSRANISSTMYEKLNQLLSYLHTSYNDKITGELLEQRFSINFDYLNRVFKKTTGNTIFSYLHQIRIDHARQLLLTTPMTLEEIASQTGFTDAYYFNRSFKKSLGITPAKYRKSRSIS